MHDNYALRCALDNYSKKAPGNVEFLPIYIYDPRQFDAIDPKTATRKCGIRRTKFITESVNALRKTFKAIGGDLLIAYDNPEIVIPALIEKNVKTVLVY